MKSILSFLVLFYFYHSPVFASSCLDEMPLDLNPNSLTSFMESQIACKEALSCDTHHRSPQETSSCFRERAYIGFRINLINSFGFQEGEDLFRKMILSQEVVKKFINAIQELEMMSPFDEEKAKTIIRFAINGRSAGRNLIIPQRNRSHMMN